MTRTDVMASGRPSTTDAAPTSRRLGWRGITAVGVVAAVLAIALIPSVAAAESEPTSGYKQTPTVSKTTPSSSVSPSKEAEKTTSTETTPTTSTKATTLPFTGFDLRWDIAVGLLLVAAGVSIVVLQRRHRRESGR